MKTDPNNPEILVRVPGDLEAAAIVNALATFGIEATTTGGYTAGFRAEAPGQVNVVVKYKDLQKAKQALAEFKQGETEVDWSQVDVGEPDEPSSS